MADLRHDGGDGAEHGARDGHERVVDKVLLPRAMREAALHALPQARAPHLVFARAHAQLVVAFVEVEVAGEEGEADEAQGAVEGEGPEEDGVRDDGGYEGGVDDRGDEGDGKVGGEEVSFVEAVEEDDEVPFAEGWAGSVEGAFVEVGRSEVGQVGVVDPARDSICGTGRKSV